MSLQTVILRYSMLQSECMRSIQNVDPAKVIQSFRLLEQALWTQTNSESVLHMETYQKKFLANTIAKMVQSYVKRLFSKNLKVRHIQA